jgi:hypothetical protein
MSKTESLGRTKRPAPMASVPATAPRQESTATTLSALERHAMIAENAYFRAAARGFQEGDPVADWLASEREVDALLASTNGRA